MNAKGGGYDDLDRLLERCRRGDDRAWETLVERFQALVYSIPRRYGMSEEDAGDVFGTTFQHLLQNLDRIEHAQAVPRWLAVTASRESLRLLRIGGKADQVGDMPVDEMIGSEEAVAEQNGDPVRDRVSKYPKRCRSCKIGVRSFFPCLTFSEEAPTRDISALCIFRSAATAESARCLRIEEAKTGDSP